MFDSAPLSEVEAVVDRVESAGGQAFVSRGGQRVVIGVHGDVEQLNLASMRGVAEVARVSEP
ncbi:hypothetical protein, partial [Nocardia tengchongensis]